MLSGTILLRLATLTLFPSLWLAGPMVSEDATRKVTKLAEGVYAIEHPGHREDGLFSGNTTVIVGSRQVFVVDSGYLPSVTRADIAQIRQWTDKPVSFLLNTHFHNDHNLGNSLYLEAFPSLTIMAHTETKKSMDLFGPGSAKREERTNARLLQMLEHGKSPPDHDLTAEEKVYVKQILDERLPYTEEVAKTRFQSATLTFDHDFSIDLGDREVQVKFLGRGNTAGDAVVYLPQEMILVVGDLVGAPIPMANDGYPTEWIQTLQNLGQLDATRIVSGHGPVLSGKSRIFLYHDLLKSAVDQMDARLTDIGPAMSHSLDDVKGSIDLSSFREPFIGDDAILEPEWDEFTNSLIKTMFTEASLR